ncbi:MAG: hypothetical protein Q9192_004483 [Flavoplaca navasiana]
MQRAVDSLEPTLALVVRAKSVFERDLSSIRMKRAERERAAAGSFKSRSPSGIVKTSPSKNSPDLAPAVPSKSEKQEVHEEPPPTLGNDLKEEPKTAEPEPNTAANPSSDNNYVTEDTVCLEPFSIPDSLPQDPNEPKGLAISIDQAPSASAPADPPKPEPMADEPKDASMQIDAIPPNLSSADFESMFEDSELPGANDEIDFDLAFPNDNANDPTGLIDASAFDNMAITHTEPANNANLGSADEDLATLLPGLENYVTDSNDFQLPDMPNSQLFDDNNDGSQKPTDGNPSLMNQGDGDRQDMSTFNPPMIESSFEDMFGLDSYMNGTGDDELGGTGDFDEDWFKTDGM